MSFIGKLHEISFYAFLTSICCLFLGKCDFSFVIVTFVTFIIIAIIGAFITKHYDKGEGLYFSSDKVLVIIFAHIAEEILGLVLTPIWFIKDIITKDWNAWKVFDYISYFIEIAIIFIIIFL